MEQYELRQRLDEVEEISGGGTWHVSLYLRESKSIRQAINEMKQEIAEAESIKSDDTQDRVQTALTKIVNALSEYDSTPENGLVVFASPNEVYALDGFPFEVSQNLYHCDSEFVTEPLRGSLGGDGTYGLIVVERGAAAVGVLQSGRVCDVWEQTSRVMGKTQAGGQSQARFERLREEQKRNFYSTVQDMAVSTFGGYDLDGVLIGGTLSSAQEFVEGYVHHEWDVLGTYSVEYATEQGLEELVERAESAIQDSEEKEARRIVEEFFVALRDEQAAYGDELDRAIEYGAVDTLLCTHNVESDRIRDLVERVENKGGEAVVFDATFEKAVMFENMTDGTGAILRFEV